MQTIIWAFGSMIVLLLVLIFLPLGFTLKGKVSIVMASFVISLGGLVASNTFSLPLIAVLLIGLIFFTAYLLEHRAGRILYAEDQSHEEKYFDLIDNGNSSEVFNVEIAKVSKFQELNALESGEPTVLNKVDETISEEALTFTSTIEETGNEEVSEMLGEDTSLLLKDEAEQMGSFHEEELEIDENYFLAVDNDLSLDEVKEDISNNDESYLSDIENLLIENLEDAFKEEKNEGHLEENEKAKISMLELDELKPLDYLYAAKEVASGIDEENERTEIEKLLQK
ncbi:hypothetical protein [Bacillus sp. UNC438CL73TsuS30]|uniref:hypothetical protein n=1 Tax=Bacillus sp. UNC438CL73TsuS30 TaxID=1340434 RepID=UPI00047C16D4|nr:hypothetical protein [Bacillus sp. UNC438CL73TsuS30]